MITVKIWLWSPPSPIKALFKSSDGYESVHEWKDYTDVLSGLYFILRVMQSLRPFALEINLTEDTSSAISGGNRTPGESSPVYV